MRGVFALTAVLALSVFGSSRASAQTVQQLKRELVAKERQIAKLENQVRELQSRPPPVPAVVVAAPAVPPSPRPVVVDVTTPDDEEGERALERTLVREGALVLSPFGWEVTPQLSFAHWDKVQDPYLKNSYSAALTARMGLPWASQVSVSLPYVLNEFRTGGSDSGLGDAGILFSKELIQESDYGLNLVANAGWTSPTRNGSTLSPIPFVSGFQGGLTASKRLDPLVVFGSVSYFSSASREIEGREYKGSDVIAGRVGGSLAISPSTSLTSGFNLSYLTDDEPDSLVVPNSDRLISSVDVGLSTIIGPRTLLNVTGQFGITGHVPDFRVITSLPVRF